MAGDEEQGGLKAEDFAFSVAKAERVLRFQEVLMVMLYPTVMATTLAFRGGMLGWSVGRANPTAPDRWDTTNRASYAIMGMSFAAIVFISAYFFSNLLINRGKNMPQMGSYYSWFAPLVVWLFSTNYFVIYVAISRYEVPTAHWWVAIGASIFLLMCGIYLRGNPVRLLREHAREVHGIDWNPVRRDSFISASWDDTLKLWSPDRPASVRTFRGHEYCVYAAAWSARHPDVFASASGDRSARVWDIREPAPTLVIPAHDHEVLSLDWDKYDPSILATASVDKSIRVWDVRSPRAPLAQLAGHGYAVKRVRFSPHRQGVLMSCSYDMTVCMWDYRKEDALLSRYGHHTEFVAGIDMSVLTEGLLASTGWDEMIYVWPFGSDPRAM